MSVLISLLMVFTFALPAFADDTPTGSITISNTVKDEEYKTYRLLDLESYDADKDVYAYKVNNAWKGFFAEGAAGAAYITIENDYASWTNENQDAATLQAFAKAALTYAAANNIQPVATETASGETVTFSNLALGYYLVDSSVGTLCTLDTTNPNAQIKDKNDKPDVEKKIEENGEKKDDNDVQIGDTIHFAIDVSVKKGAENYVLHDTMTAGLTFNNDIAIDGLTEGTDYTVSTTNADGCTFEVKFADNYLNSVTAATTVTVKYTATLNNQAVIKDANTNKAHLTYGSNSSTTEKETETYTYQLTVVKTNTSSELLANAIFELSKNGTTIKFNKPDANKEEYVVDPNGSVTQITTDDSGTFVIKGLGTGEYQLTEIKAPAGYNTLADPITITVSRDGIAKGGAKLSNDTLTVENQSGSLLPSTGGIGTTIFYVIGGLMMLVAAVLLITKKRMSRNK